jgi:hypothetical protein
MEKGRYVEALLRSRKTVFSVSDIALLWQESRNTVACNRLLYYLKQGQLIRLRHGIYARDKAYERLELATKIMTPAYVSFETVLAKAGMIFQYYRDIYVASYLTKEIVCDETLFSFRTIKDSVLTNPMGIDQKNEYAIATPERALLDTLYLNKDFYFDNLSTLDWDKAFSLVSIYENKRLCKTLETLYKQYKAE